MTTVRSSPFGDGVVLLTLDKPPANAIDEKLLTDLRRALAAVRDDDATRAVVLTGAGSFFSAGFDFAAPRRDDEIALDLYKLYRDCHLELFALPKPTIAMIGGHCIAGGFVIALACDHRIAVAGDYRIGMNEVAVGASFPCAAMEIVRARLTQAQAGDLILGAKLLPASAAITCGLAGEIVEPAELEARARTLAGDLSRLARDSYAHSKAALISEATARIAAETDEQAVATMTVWISEESRAARRRQRERLNVRS